MIRKYDRRKDKNFDYTEEDAYLFDKDYLEDDGFTIYTQLYNNEPVCYIFYKERGHKEYGTFFYIKKDFPVMSLKEIKRFIHCEAKKTQARKVFTYSKTNDKNKRFHEFLGLEKIKDLETGYSLWVLEQ